MSCPSGWGKDGTSRNISACDARTAQRSTYSAEVDVRQLQVCLVIHTLSAVVEPIRAARAVEEPFIADRHHVLGVQALDIGRHLIDPAGDCGGGAGAGVGQRAGAAGLIRELPRKDGRRVSIPRHHRLDVVLVRGLDVRVRVERRLSAAGGKGVDVHLHPAVVGPVVDEGDDEAHAALLRRSHNVIQSTQTRGAGVDGH